MVEGLAAMCRELDVPVVGGNVSLYNDSASGPIPPTPTVLMVGTTPAYHGPPGTFVGEGDLVFVGTTSKALGGSEYLRQFGGTDQFPSLPAEPAAQIAAIARVARLESTLSVHDVSHGGLATSLAEMVTGTAGAKVAFPEGPASPRRLFAEAPGRVIIETTDRDAVETEMGGVAPVTSLGTTVKDGILEIETETGSVAYTHRELASLRAVLDAELG